MVIGILAHVDAGKTTLSENILYRTGSIRSVGRVDDGDTFLDTDDMEKKRGITIYSKEAVFELGDKTVYLIDTPGHVDFSAEMERTLQVLDYAILVVSGTDGVQTHTLTLWNLFSMYHIPVFIFVNKMDMPNADRQKVFSDIEKMSRGRAVDFTDILSEDTREAMAMADEDMLERYMESGEIEDISVAKAVMERKICPVCFGAALKSQGIEEFLNIFERYTVEKVYGEKSKAVVFKIVRNINGTRLTYVKVTGGELNVKSIVTYKNREEKTVSEKIDQIRIYSGDKYTVQTSVEAGCICALTGLTYTRAGQHIIESSGSFVIQENSGRTPVIEPVLMYRMVLPEGCDTLKTLRRLRELEEEEPQLNVVWNRYLSEIYVKVMGKVQLEILKGVILDRFNIEVEFDSGNIVYRETIADRVEGVGHFEPLRHYAEVHVIMEPLPQGAGMVFDTDCSEDVLDKNWQRLILTHLKEKEHRGVLTGSAVTDMKITLAAGRAHQKHTEGGDFRQATYRAVRQGLMEAESVLLEPYYAFRIELPSEMLGRAMTDIQRMYGTSEVSENDGDMAMLKGKCPVATLSEYQTELNAYTKGRGKIFLSVDGYGVCHNESEVIEKLNYDPLNDMENPTGSVFCAQGAGYNVPWDEVKSHMHVESALKETAVETAVKTAAMTKDDDIMKYYGGEDELKEIFERTFGTSYHGIRGGDKEKSYNPYKKTNNFDRRNSKAVKNVGGTKGEDDKYIRKKDEEKCEEYLLVDGYNIIFAWEELERLSRDSLDGARMSLLEIMCNYQGYAGGSLIVVFDAYKVQGHKGTVEKYKNIYVVYTKEAETADQYIEKTVHEIGRKHRVTVATSDRLEQMIILGDGASRMSAAGFKAEVNRVVNDIRNVIGH